MCSRPKWLLKEVGFHLVKLTGAKRRKSGSGCLHFGRQSGGWDDTLTSTSSRWHSPYNQNMIVGSKMSTIALLHDLKRVGCVVSALDF